MKDCPIILAKNIGGWRTVSEIIVDFFVCLFEVYIFFDFLHDILENKLRNKGILVIALAGISLVMCGINQLHISQLNLLGGIVLFLICIVFMFYGDSKKKISYFLIFYIIMTGMEFVVGLLFVSIVSPETVTYELYPFRNFIMVIITKLLSFVALRLIKLFWNRKEVGMRGKLLKMTFLFPVTTIMLYAGLFYANAQVGKGKSILCLGCILLLFSNVLVFYIVEKLTLVLEQNKEYEMMRLQNTFNHTYYQKLEEMGQKQKQYAHDLKEYLQTIGGLAVKNRNVEIVDIIKSMEVEIDSISDKMYTNHSILNALLCEKEQCAKQKGIEVSIMVEPELNVDFIKNSDLILMVGNLFSNAIEAAVLCESKKQIDLKFFSSDSHFIVLDIENTYGNKIKRIGEQYLSTKKDGINHGIGIKSVRQTAEKYGGILFQEQKDGVFASILTLSKAY